MTTNTKNSFTRFAAAAAVGNAWAKTSFYFVVFANFTNQIVRSCKQYARFGGTQTVKK